MTALARAVDVLAQRPLVTLHHVPTSGRHRASRESGQGEHAAGGGQSGQTQAMQRHAGGGNRRAGTHEVHVVAARHQRLDEAGRRALDAAVKRQLPRDQGDLH